MINLSRQLKLCLVIGFSEIGKHRMYDVIAQAIKGGITALQLRDKTATENNIATVGMKLKKHLPHHIMLIINDYVDVAKYLNVSLHIGQSDISQSIARRMLGNKSVIGLSIENTFQAQKHQYSSVDYFGVGPLFKTNSKPDAAKPQGLKTFNRILQILSQKPCVAIGGITSNNVHDIRKSTVTGIAVMSSIINAKDPVAVTRYLSNVMDSPCQG